MESFNSLVEYAPLLLKGLWMTLALGLCAMVLAVFFGLVSAIGRKSENYFIRLLIELYAVIIRGVPELIIILLVYYGVPILVANISQSFGYPIELDLNPFIAGFITIGFIYGAFASEVFRGAFAAISTGEIEAAHSIGMSKKQTFLRIELPQAMRYSLPGLANIWMVLIKATSLVSVISLYELINYGRIAVNNTGLSFTFYFTISLIFLLITIISMWGQNKLESYNKRTGFEP